MWTKNNDNGKWYRKIDVLEKDKFDSLKQDIEKVRLYSKCLSGSTYVAINSLNNIYDILDNRDEYNWFIGLSGSTYSISGTPSNPKSIDLSSRDEFYNKFSFEYGLTLKNKFTPIKLINDVIDNYIEVDVSTTENLLNIGSYSPGLIIDGVILKNGHTVLVKDQKSYISLSASVDPETYFTHSYYINATSSSSIEYYYFNYDNGVYSYDKNVLNRTADLISYEDSYKYSISIKLGDLNSQKQYHLSRLKSGYYPLYKNGDSMEFLEKKNWILRNRIDYNNIYEISYYDILKHNSFSYYDKGYTYSIPQRVISVGEFGMIIVNQGNISNIINNKYKVTLRSISETSRYYWICGDEGVVLRVSKLNFDVVRCNITEFSNFMSIDFVDDLRGIVVGKFNTVYFTEDGGYSWKNISQREFDAYSYNKVIYNNFDKAYIGGDSGTFIQMSFNNNIWTFYKRRILKYLDINEPTEEYLFVDDINDMCLSSFTSSNPWGLSYSSATSSTISTNKEVLFMVGNGGNFLLYDINNFIPQYEFLHFSFTQSKSDINSITTVSGSSSIYFTSDKVYSIDINNFKNIDIISNSISSTYSAIEEYDKYINNIFDYNGVELYLCGNNSSLYYSGYTSSIFEIDSKFNNRYTSKLLFLDYEIGSKLNFFDDTQIYRLPNSVTFSSDKITNILAVRNKSNEYNWLNYYKDAEKTFEYYTSIGSDTVVEFSTTFSFAPTTYFSFTSSEINISLEGIKNLAPNIDSFSASEFISGTTSIIGTTYSGIAFLYKNLMVFKKTILYPCDVGDVLYFESDIITTTLLVNKKFIDGYDVYLYCYVDFNRTVVNDIKNYGGTISVSNLNKYSNFGVTSSNSIITDVLDDTWNYDNNIDPLDYFAYSSIGTYSGDILLNFNLHPISNGYKLSYSDNLYTLSAKFNNKTSYYNMQSEVITLTSSIPTCHYYEVSNLETDPGFAPYQFIYTDCDGILHYFPLLEEESVILPMSSGSITANFEYSVVDLGSLFANTLFMNYTDPFLKFGYKPTYNLYDYLNNIDSIKFYSSKRFFSMPRYESMRGNSTDTFTSSNIYIDTNIDTNKLLLGSNFEFEWNSLWVNTFVDVNLYTTSSTYSSERMLIVKKYEESGGYVIEFHKKLNYNYGDPIEFVDILSRNTLQNISDDLQMMNNIQRSQLSKTIQSGSNFFNLNNELNFKIPTDSYSKILLSDRDIKYELSGIVFIDDKNELALNIISLEEEFNLKISSTSRYASTPYLLITCSQSHNLSKNDGIVVTFTGSTTSNIYNQSYFGYQVIKGVVDEYSFFTDRNFGMTISGYDSGIINFIKKDPFLNYEPIDIMDVGVDKQVKRAIEIKPENIGLSGSQYYLNKIDFTKYRYQLVDGISVNTIYDKYPWILEGEISNAVIGEDKNGLVWYSGDWNCGRWFGGTWYSGRWIGGDWYGGIWNSYNVRYKLLNVDVNKSVEIPSASKWYSGRWFDGTWNNGTWYNGRRYNGVWNNGTWYNGIWNDGTWNNGKFLGGIWILGNWNGGIFNCDNKPSYWIDGNWYGGDFENGMWYNGQFLEKEKKISRFGTKAFNTRTATWQAGKFSGGEFHSYLNVDSDGDTFASEFNKYSIWKTGIWNGGDWYGGVAYAINFNTGIWWGGIVEEIQVIGIEILPNVLSKLILNGNFKFNVGDDICVVNDNTPTPYYLIGTNDSPGYYKVLLTEEDGEITTITINRNLYPITGTVSVSDIDTGLRLTSVFKNSIWKSGVWTNGIFDGGYFEGGIWYGGLFNKNSNWGR